MKAFVTGGTGFIGGFLVRRLLEGRHQVRCLVRSGASGERLRALGAEVVPGELSSRAALLEGMKGCDRVVHGAAAYSFWTKDPSIYRAANVEGVRNVMECALEAGVAKVIHLGSVVTLGKVTDSPATEKTAARPGHPSDYARSKWEGEEIAWRLRETRGLPLVVIMPGGVFGPGDPKATGHYIRNLVERRLPATVFTDRPFPWVHVRDVAEGIVRAAEKQGNEGEKYILAAESLTFGEINRMVGEISGVGIPRWRIPDPLAMAGAHLLTALSRVTGRPPMLGMSVDQFRTMRDGFAADGSKAARELGIRYTPIRRAIEEAIESFPR